MTSIKVIALLIFLASSVAHASLYRWVDENGKVHFSDKVPPSIAQKGHTSLNKHGVESAKVSSSDELKKKEEEANTKQEVSDEMTDAKKAEVLQKQKDKEILATYGSKEEVISVFNKRISLIEQSIGIMVAREESLAQKINRLGKKYKKTKRESSQMTISMQIESARQSLNEYQKSIEINRANKEAVTGKYRQTLIRFDHLTDSSQ